jgi:hypothetical protein
MIPERTDQLGKLHAEHVARPEAWPKANKQRSRIAGVNAEAAIQALKCDPRRQDLFDGGNLDYASDSEADGALFHHLAFFCQGDVALMEEVALRSGRRRPKWEERRNGTTWLRWELGKAANRVTETWDPAGDGMRPGANGSGEPDGHTSFVSFVNFVLEPPPWPVLSDEAFHGLPGKIVKAIEPHTEADPVAILVNLLSAFGNAIGRGAYFRVGADTHYLKVNAGLVGETSKGRKGMSWGHVRELMQAADSEWTKERVLHGLSSGEGLIYAVRDRVAGENKKGEPVVLDSGVEDKRLLVLEAELASVLKVMSREGNTLSPIIRQAWDDGALQTLTKNSPMKATGAHVSIIGHITKSELLRHLTETEAANGFANRFIWLLVKRSKELPFGGEWYKVDATPLVRCLNAALEFGGVPVEITWGKGARDAWREVYGPLSEGKPGLFGAIVGRAEAQVMRLAAIYAVMDESYEIEHEHLLAALALWEYAEASARYIFGDATGDPVADQIAEALKAAGGDGMTRTDISSLFGRNKSADHIGRALGLLLSIGCIRRETEETKGRPSERWFTK